MKFSDVIKTLCVCGCVFGSMCDGVRGMKICIYNLGMTPDNAVSFINDVDISMDIYDHLSTQGTTTSDTIFEVFNRYNKNEELTVFLHEFCSYKVCDIFSDANCRVPCIVFHMMEKSNDEGLKCTIREMMSERSVFKDVISEYAFINRSSKAKSSVVCKTLLEMTELYASGCVVSFLSDYIYLCEVNVPNAQVRNRLGDLLEKWSDKEAECMKAELLES